MSRSICTLARIPVSSKLPLHLHKRNYLNLRGSRERVPMELVFMVTKLHGLKSGLSEDKAEEYAAIVRVNLVAAARKGTPVRRGRLKQYCAKTAEYTLWNLNRKSRKQPISTSQDILNGLNAGSEGIRRGTRGQSPQISLTVRELADKVVKLLLELPLEDQIIFDLLQRGFGLGKVEVALKSLGYQPGTKSTIWKHNKQTCEWLRTQLGADPFEE